MANGAEHACDALICVPILSRAPGLFSGGRARPSGAQQASRPRNRPLRNRLRRPAESRHRQARRLRLRHAHGGGPHGSANRRVAGGAGAAADRRRACRRLRPLSRARAPHRLQRSAHHRRDARVAHQPQRSPADGRLQFFRASSRSRAWSAICLRRSIRNRASSSVPRWYARSRPTARCIDDPRIRQTLLREVGRGEDYFRSAVIEALGDYKALYAYDALVAVAKLDGPLQDDAALALGKIGDKRALATLAIAAAERRRRSRNRPSPRPSVCSA